MVTSEVLVGTPPHQLLTSFQLVFVPNQVPGVEMVITTGVDVMVALHTFSTTTSYVPASPTVGLVRVNVGEPCPETTALSITATPPFLHVYVRPFPVATTDNV